jgi:hypothetical protein
MAKAGEAGAEGAQEWDLSLEELDREELERFGRILDQRPASLRGRTVGMALAERLLLVRTREGWTAPLKANVAQRAFERRRGERNIVLKARQMGMTTWAAARFFLKTITQPGTLTLEVAHTQEAAEEIFRIVHRFVDWLPEELRAGPLRTSRANVRQIVFPEMDSQYRVVTAGDRNAGRGLTVQNLHCSELARWPGDAAETLAGLRAAMTPGAELILESTPDGVGGCFHEEWRKAGETGMVRHFFPWWMERCYRAKAVEEATLTGEERDLMARKRLDREQIGYRREIRADFRRLARQEYAEDEESCFLASGNSVFELAAIEARLATAPARSTWWPWTRPGAAARETIRRPRCWRWRRVCSARSLPATWGVWSWRGWRRRWPRSTTRRGWWWRGTTTAAACWRWRRRCADTGGFTVRRGRRGG